MADALIYLLYNLGGPDVHIRRLYANCHHTRRNALDGLDGPRVHRGLSGRLEPRVISFRPGSKIEGKGEKEEFEKLDSTALRWVLLRPQDHLVLSCEMGGHGPKRANHMVQVLSRHECFAGYLHQIQRKQNVCFYYGREVDMVRHTLIECLAWDMESRAFTMIGNDLYLPAR